MDIQFPFFSLFIFGEMFFSEFVHFKLLSLLIVVHNNPFFIICKICNDAPSFIPNIINCFVSFSLARGLAIFSIKQILGFVTFFYSLFSVPVISVLILVSSLLHLVSFYFSSSLRWKLRLLVLTISLSVSACF